MILLLLWLIGWLASADDSGLPGLWRQDCRASAVREFLIDSKQSLYIEHFYSDPLCTVDAYSFKSVGSFNVGAPRNLPVGAKDYDFLFESVWLKPDSSAVATSFNSMKLCGLGDWKLNEWKEITAMSCNFGGFTLNIPHRGFVKFGVYKIEVNYLFFGKLSQNQSGTSPDTRPKQWDPYGYKRVFR